MPSPPPSTPITHYPRRSLVEGHLIKVMRDSYATICNLYVPLEEVALNDDIVTCLECLATEE
jgi:hypothetical protein